MSIHIKVSDNTNEEVHAMIDKFISRGYVLETVLSRAKDVAIYKETLVVNEDEEIIYMDGDSIPGSIAFEDYKPNK